MTNDEGVEMTTSTQGPDGTPRLTVVSGDSHVGPRLADDLRQFCPQKYLEEFDRFTAATVDTMDAAVTAVVGKSTQASEVIFARTLLNRSTAGHYDIDTRIREMDWDGVAAEVIFHGSVNTEVFPFAGTREWSRVETRRDHELLAVGYRMYNRWLSEFVSVQPERHIGLAYVPMWDVDLALAEVKFAAGAGLRGVNFPVPREGIAEYDDPNWEPLWSACEDFGLNLVTHCGVDGHRCFGPQQMAMTMIEGAGWPARRGMHRLIFGGVFERHPGLKLVLTEFARGWWNSTMRELDSVYASPSEALRGQVPRSPSEYMKENVFIGASFMPPSEVREAMAEGYADQLIWGRDYPHGEGPYKYPESDDEESQTRHYLRWAFAGCPLEVAQDMLSETAIGAYGLDREALAVVAARIGPTPDEVIAPLIDVPNHWAPNLVDLQTGEMANV